MTVAHALLEVGDGLARASHRLERHDWVVAEDFALGHDIEVVAG